MLNKIALITSMFYFLLAIGCDFGKKESKRNSTPTPGLDAETETGEEGGETKQQEQGGQETGDGKVDGAFLSPSDFSSLTYTQVNLKDELQSHFDKYTFQSMFHKSTDSQQTDEDLEDNREGLTEECRKALSGEDITFVGDGEKGRYSADTDIHCEYKQKSSQGDETKVKVHIVRQIYSSFECEDYDFTGKTMKDLEEADFIASCNNLKYMFNIDQEYTYEFSGASFENKSTHKFKRLEATPSNGMCVFSDESGKMKLQGKCLEYNYSYSEFGTGSDKQLTKTLSKVTFEGVVADASRRDLEYYQGGSAKVEINNWEGTVTYNSKGKLPQIDISNGSETINGDLDDVIITTSQEQDVYPDEKKPQDKPQNKS